MESFCTEYWPGWVGTPPLPEQALVMIKLAAAKTAMNVRILRIRRARPSRSCSVSIRTDLPAPERLASFGQGATGNVELRHRADLPSLPRLEHRCGRLERLLEQSVGATHREQRIGGRAHRGPGWLDVDQTGLAPQAIFHLAHRVAGGVDARRLFAQRRARLDQLVEQPRHLRSLRIRQAGGQRQDGQYQDLSLHPERSEGSTNATVDPSALPQDEADDLIRLCGAAKLAPN